MKCQICNNETVLIKDIDEKEYVACKNCHIIQLKKEYHINKNLEKKQYDYHNNSFENKGYVQMFENFLDFFYKYLETTEYALDFGSGPNPVLAKILKNRGFENVDYFDKFYQPKKVYEGKKYDLITSTEVFEHLTNPKNTLNLLKNHLKKDGILAVMTLFHSNKHNEFLKWWYKRDPTHITFYTPHSFEVLADMCGLKVVKSDNKRIIILKLL